MNDVPENELLSAYLDGELSPAERAKVEQLLAADPAARHLLDELRALSSTLRALPRAKVGEDLNRQVLRAAERRMLTPAPGALGGRFHWRNMLGRRALLWSGLAVAIAIMLTINDRSQRRVAEKQIALAPPAAPIGPAKPPVIEAVSGAKQPAARGEERVAAADKALRKGTVPFSSNENRDSPRLSGGAVKQKAKPPNAMAIGGSTPGAAKVAAAPGPDRRAVTEANRQPPPGPSVEQLAKTHAPAIGAEAAADLADAAGSVMVVRCDVTPDAMRQHAFDQLLAANGIAPQKATGRNGAAIHVYVEAAPAQIEAVLSQIAARPAAFPTVAVNPAANLPAQQSLTQYAHALHQGPGTASVGGLAQTENSATAMSKKDEDKGSRPPGGKVQQIVVPLRALSGGPAASGRATGSVSVPWSNGGGMALPPVPADETKPQSGPKQGVATPHEAPKAAAPASQPSTTYRVLFVLRTIGSESPAAGGLINAVSPSAPPAAPKSPPNSR